MVPSAPGNDKMASLSASISILVAESSVGSAASFSFSFASPSAAALSAADWTSCARFFSYAGQQSKKLLNHTLNLNGVSISNKHEKNEPLPERARFPARHPAAPRCTQAPAMRYGAPPPAGPTPPGMHAATSPSLGKPAL